MGDDGPDTEEIYGAPPAESRAEIRERRLSESVTLNRYLYQQAQQLESMLLHAPDIQSLLEVLLVSMPRHFGFPVAELWLYDPEVVLADLMDCGHRYGRHMKLHSDGFDILGLYDLETDIGLVDANDSRRFEALKEGHCLG